MSDMFFYNEDELNQLGLKSFGENVLISRKCSLYGIQNISIGDNVRIDDFCILSGNIKLGSHIHISAYCALYGNYGVEFENFTGISPKSIIYSAIDDFSGDYLIGSIHKKEKTNLISGKVLVKQYAHIGTQSTVFPNITIAEGAVIGAYSLVVKSVQPWSINVGIPARHLKNRRQGLLSLI